MKEENEVLRFVEEKDGETLSFIEGVEAMYEECAIVIPTGWWDISCVILHRHLHDDDNGDGGFFVVRPEEVSKTGGIVYTDSCVVGEYHFTAGEMLTMEFRKSGPWYYELWTKEVNHE